MKSCPVYAPVIERLRRMIAAHPSADRSPVATELDLVRRTGLSRVSIRSAVDALIAEGLIERVAGKGLYVRDAAVTTRTVEVMVPDLRFDQCVRIAQGAQARAERHGVRVHVYDAHRCVDADVAMLRSLPERGVDGAIVFALDHPRFAEAVYALAAARFPLVLVDRPLRDLAVDSVCADHYAGGHAVGRELAARGHTRIGCIGRLAEETVRARFDGLRDALLDARVAFDRSLVVDLAVPPLGDWAPAIIAATRSLVARERRPTALFASNDEVAAHAYRALADLGLRIPKDVSVVGFDDNPLCGWLAPPLATVRQPSVEIGAAACDLLVQRMADRAAPVGHRVLPVAWVARESVRRRP